MESYNLRLILGQQCWPLEYQSLLLEGPVTELKICGNLNFLTFLREKENETPDHDYYQFINLNYATLED